MLVLFILLIIYLHYLTELFIHFSLLYLFISFCLFKILLKHLFQRKKRKHQEVEEDFDKDDAVVNKRKD